MYSTFNEGKSVVAENFIRILKNKIYKHLTVVSKNAYIDNLDLQKELQEINPKFEKNL